MSVEMTHCSHFGWASDRRGDRYDAVDRRVVRLGPGMPIEFRKLAMEAALAANFPKLEPNACPINRYDPRRSRLLSFKT